jgi:hypothetical protein
MRKLVKRMRDLLNRQRADATLTRSRIKPLSGETRHIARMC